MNKERRYQSYLLRLWQESDASPPLWRASLERPQDGQRLGFPSLEDLFAHLRERTDTTPPAGGLEKGRRTPETSSE